MILDDRNPYAQRLKSVIENNEGSIMNGALVFNDEGLRLRIVMAKSGEVVLDLGEEDADFEHIVDMFGITHQVKLLQIEHDLNNDCTCVTCKRVGEISRST